MSDENSAANSTNEMLAQRIFDEVLPRLRQAIVNKNPEANGDEISRRLKEELREFNKEWQERVESLLGAPPLMKVLKGKFVAIVRLPGEDCGAAAGRVPGLQPWREPQSSEVVRELAKGLAEIQEGARYTLEFADLPFCPGGHLWHISFPAGPGHPQADADAFAIAIGEEFHRLDWTNEPIYRLFEARRLRYSGDLRLYIRFFFHVVQGQLGRFTIIENEADLRARPVWQKTTAGGAGSIEDARKEAAQFVMPLRRKAMNADGESAFRGAILFRNALFHSDVVVSPNGQVRLENEELQKDNLPVEFGQGSFEKPSAVA